MRRVRTGAAASLAVAVVLGSMATAPGFAEEAPPPIEQPSEPEPAPPAPPPPPVMPTEIGSVCQALLPPRRPGLQREKAQELMRGYVDLGKGGSY